MKLYASRGIAIFLTQVTIIYYVAGSRNLLLGFNQTDKGLLTLLLLVGSVPLLNLYWIFIEAKTSVRNFRLRKRVRLILMPLVAVVFLIESIVIDGYILSQARM